MADIITELETQLTQALEVEARIDVLNKLARAVQHLDVDRAIALSQEAILLAQPDKNKPPLYLKGLAHGLHNLGEFEYEAGRYESAMADFLESLRLYEKLADLPAQARVISWIGETYAYLGNYSDALTYQLQALKLCEVTQDKVNEANTHNQIGKIYFFMADYRQSLEYVRRSLWIYQELQDIAGEAKLLNNLGFVYSYLKNYDEALHHCLRSLELARQHELKDTEAHTLDSLGMIYQELADYPQALYYFQQGLDVFQNMNRPSKAMECMRNVGDTYYRLKDIPRALEYLQQALALAEQFGVRWELYICHELLAKVYKELGQFERALSHYEQFHTIKESVLSEETTDKLKKLEIVHRTETAYKTAEIYRLKNVELEQEITERKRIEEALRKSELELQQTNKELAKLNIDKDRFLSLIAHDLRSPFMPLLGLTDMLLDITQETDSAEVYDIAKSIYTSSKHIYNLLEDLLQWARLHMGRMKYQARQVELGEVATQIVQLLHYNAQSKQITLKNQLPMPLWVHGDEQMLSVVLRNLISNAIKFTPDKGRVEVRATLLASEPPLVEIAVTDTGMGISADDIAKLFKIEVHHSTLGTSQERGTGLGLIMCHEMIELHGGKIWIESDLGHGTTVKFTVPLERVETFPKSFQPEDINISTITYNSYPPLPIEWLNVLLHFALAGDMVALQLKAAEIAQLDATFQPFTDQLQLLAHNFDEERILVLLRHEIEQLQRQSP